MAPLQLDDNRVQLDPSADSQLEVPAFNAHAGLQQLEMVRGLYLGHCVTAQPEIEVGRRPHSSHTFGH